MTKWLDLWACARGEHANHSNSDSVSESSRCQFGPLKDANTLPEWFGIRAEFELNVLLYHMVGERNITYHDFLNSTADHFTAYASAPEHYSRQPRDNERALRSDPTPSVSIRGELQRCVGQSRTTAAGKPANEALSPREKIRVTILRSLVQNENTRLRSDFHFLAGRSWADMENMYERGLFLARFPLERIYPEEDTGREIWAGILNEYQITAGLLGIAVADRLAASNNSADDRNRAIEIKTEAKALLRQGYRNLKKLRDDDRDKIAVSRLSERVFYVSDWEESCSLAERAIYQLNE